MLEEILFDVIAHIYYLSKMNLIVEICNNTIFVMMLSESIDNDVIVIKNQMINKVQSVEVKVLIQYWIDLFHYKLIKANEIYL